MTARSCWRCAEPIGEAVTRCPACGARVIPLDAGQASPAEAARKLRRMLLGGLLLFFLMILGLGVLLG